MTPTETDVHPLSHRAVELATLTLSPTTKKPLARIFSGAEVDGLLKDLGLGGTKDSAVDVGAGTGGATGDVAMAT